MRSVLKNAGIIAVMIISCAVAQAQNELQMSLGYRVDVPVGAFKNYISHAAGRGFNADIAYSLTSQLVLGLNISYNDFYQKYPRAVYNDGQGNSISAVISNTVQQIPLQLSADYILLNKGFVHPYVSGGAGINIISYDQYLGEYDNLHSKVKPILNVGGGVYIPVSRVSSTSIKIGASYNYAPLNENGIKNLNTIGIHAGVMFPIY